MSHFTRDNDIAFVWYNQISLKPSQPAKFFFAKGIVDVELENYTLNSHFSKILCNSPILHHLHRKKANKQEVTNTKVLTSKRSHLITRLSL